MADAIPIPTHPRFQDLNGKIFGRLTVNSYAGQGPSKETRWNCHCSCGNIVIRNSRVLKHGRSTSCGCYRLERVAQATRTHGHSKTPEYRSWKCMRGRCDNPTNDRFADYGGRGITVCRRWRESVGSFLADMGLRPSAEHTIDRIDNDGHYSCGHCTECIDRGWLANCRWATKAEQGCNRRDNRYLEYQGKSLTIKQWAAIIGIKRHTLWARLKLNWTIEEALTIPVRRGNKLAHIRCG